MTEWNRGGVLTRALASSALTGGCVRLLLAGGALRGVRRHLTRVRIYTFRPGIGTRRITLNHGTHSYAR